MPALSNLELLRRVPLFSALTTAQSAAVADAIGKRRFKRNEEIVEQGQRTNTLSIILTGRARVVAIDCQDREVIISTLRPGDYIGEMSLIDGQPHSATVRAEETTDVLVLGREAFLSCLHDNMSMMRNMVRGLVKRLRQADRKIASLALMDVHGRVIRTLMEVADIDDAGHLRIREKISRQDLAKMVGASREMVSRVMNELEERSLISVQEDGSTLVLDPLVALSERPDQTQAVRGFVGGLSPS
ncbi:MAG: Crp/Fnr family transcriptional regulator [Burkholderiaceae bacterium]|jgi:CRP-like cAMP-binding protein|nr:Crp/Fnr family transcriptional regulator [Burkholderiaceae bacterium]